MLNYVNFVAKQMRYQIKLLAIADIVKSSNSCIRERPCTCQGSQYISCRQMISNGDGYGTIFPWRCSSIFSANYNVYFLQQKVMPSWPSGLRRCTQVAVSSDAEVRIFRVVVLFCSFAVDTSYPSALVLYCCTSRDRDYTLYILASLRSAWMCEPTSY